MAESTSPKIQILHFPVRTGQLEVVRTMPIPSSAAYTSIQSINEYTRPGIGEDGGSLFSLVRCDRAISIFNANNFHSKKSTNIQITSTVMDNTGILCAYLCFHSKGFKLHKMTSSVDMSECVSELIPVKI